MKALAVFYGDDAYALDTGIDNYIQGALPAEVRPFNFETLGPDTGAAAVILAAATLPFAADQRLTLVKNPAFALEKRPGGQLTEDQKALLAYLDNPNPVHGLIFRLETDAAPGKFLKALAEKAAWHDCSKPKPDSLHRAARDRLKAAGKSLDYEADALLFQAARGWTAAILQSELDKVLLYYVDKDKLTAEDLARVFSKSVQTTIFTLLDAAMTGQTAKALAAYDDLLATGEMKSAPQVLARLIDSTRTLLAVQGMQSEHRTQADMAKRLGKHPFVIKKSLSQARGIPTDLLVDRLSYLLDQDIRAKTLTGLDEEALIRETLIAITSRPAGRKK